MRKIIDLTNDERDTHRGRVESRIKQLRRKTWKWVKHTPRDNQEMCAIADNCSSLRGHNYVLDDETRILLDAFTRRHTDNKFQCIIEYNDSPAGAKTVDDVIVLMEKFVAEL